MSTTGARAIDPEDAEALLRRLRQTLVSGNFCLHASPFRENGWECVPEVFRLGGRDDLERLHALLVRTGQVSLVAASYRSDDGRTVVFETLHRVPRGESGADLEPVAIEVGFAINGMQFYLFDESFSWCIVTVVDAQLTTGESAALAILHPDSGERREAERYFWEYMHQPGTDEEYRRLAERVVPQRSRRR